MGKDGFQLIGRTGGAILLASALLLMACDESTDETEDGEPAVGISNVEVDDDFFAPRAIEVPVGTEVTWTWVGGRPHDVVGEDFRTEIQRDGTFVQRFDRSGTYEYRCTVHPGMTGRVIVTEGP